MHHADIFSYPDSTGFLAYDPRADDRVLPLELWEWAIGLVHEALCSVRTIGLVR